MVRFSMVDKEMVKSEKQIQKEIVNYLKEENYSVDVITKGMHGNNGISDIIAVGHGKILYIEVKRPGKKATELQRLFLQEKNRMGAFAIVATSVNDVKDILRHSEKKLVTEYN